MNKVAIIFLTLILSFPLIAQEEEMLIDDEFESGGFGGPVIKITQMNKENAVLVGGRGGWLINHTFLIGGGGYGLVTDVAAKVADTVNHLNKIELGYGGLEFEYIASSNKLIHLSFGVLIGGGGIGYRDDQNSDNHHSMDRFFVIEPGVNVNLNVTRFFRIAAGGSYRYVKGIDHPLSSDTDLSGPSAVLTLKFGKF